MTSLAKFHKSMSRLFTSRISLTALFVLLLSSTLSAAEEGVPEAAQVNGTAVFIGWFVALAGSILALFFARKFFVWVVAQDEGDETMIKIAENVRPGGSGHI